MKVSNPLHDFLTKDSYEKLYAIVANIADMTIEVDRDARIQFIRIPGVPPERLDYVIGETAYSFVMPNSREAIEKAFEKVFKEGKPQRYEVQSEDLRWWDSVISPVGEVDPQRAIIIATDITHRKRIEVLREGQNAALGKLITGEPLDEVLAVVARTVEQQVDNMKCSIWLLEEDKLVSVAAPSFSPEHIEAIVSAPFQKLRTYLSEAARDDVLIVIEDILQSEIVSEHGEICERFGHRCEWLRPFANAAGEVVGLIGLCGPETGAPDDETRRMLETAARFTGIAIQGRANNEELRRNEERFRTYFDSCLIGIAISTPDTIWIEVNDRFAEILGYKKEELVGESWKKYTHPDDLASSVEWVKAAAIDPRLRLETFRKQFVRADGTVADCELYSGVVHKPDGEIDYFVTLVQDVTERNRANEEIRRRDEMLKHYDRLASMGAMAAEIAHEIVQPLSTLSMLSESLEVKLRREGANVSEEALASIEKIKKVALNAARVTQGITRFARGHGKSPEYVTLGDLVSRTLALLESDLDRNKVRWTLEHSANQATVFVEDVLIQQVIVNLVRNAVQAMKANQGERRLVIRTRWLENDIVEVEVADNGPGVDSQQAARIFDAFVSESEGGVGLGLAICKSVIASHDGSIRVQPSDLGGSSFCFTLPTTEED